MREHPGIQMMCDADFRMIAINTTRADLSLVTLEWAQQAYNRSQWEGEVNE